MGVFVVDGVGMGGMREVMKELEVSGMVLLIMGLIGVVERGRLEGLS